MTELPSSAGAATSDVRPVRPTRTLAAGDPPVIASAQLFAHGNAVRIEHAGQHYLLRVTRENKLILTK